MPLFKDAVGEIAPLSMRNQTAFVRAMDRTTNIEAARSCGCAPSTLSEWTGEHMGRAMQVLAAVGLRVVPKEERTISPKEREALLLFAKKGMEAEQADSDFGALTP